MTVIGSIGRCAFAAKSAGAPSAALDLRQRRGRRARDRIIAGSPARRPSPCSVRASCKHRFGPRWHICAASMSCGERAEREALPGIYLAESGAVMDRLAARCAGRLEAAWTCGCFCPDRSPTIRACLMPAAGITRGCFAPACVSSNTSGAFFTPRRCCAIGGPRSDRAALTAGRCAGTWRRIGKSRTRTSRTRRRRAFAPISSRASRLIRRDGGVAAGKRARSNGSSTASRRG